jgi:hypothetical protein
MTEADCQKIRTEVKAAVLEAMMEIDQKHRAERTEAIQVHIDSCPIGKSYGNFRASLVGIMTGVSAVGGVMGGFVVFLGKAFWEFVTNGRG